jgi:aminoglycoside phosphotransferase (APT) family kinase protein
MTSPRRLTFELTLDQVRPIIQSLDGSPTVEGISRLQGGSTEVYRIDLAGRADPLVLKIYRDEPVWAPAKEAWVAGLIGEELDLPIPHWLEVDESRTRLPLRFALITFLPGQPLRSLISEPDVDIAYRKMGAWLRQVHTIEMSAFGYVGGGEVFGSRSSNADAMRIAFEAAFRAFRNHGPDSLLASRLETLAQARFELLDHCTTPVLCHDDFQQGNILAARDAAGHLGLTGLIDFENARAGDPLMDLAKALFCSTHEDPASREPLLDGYGSIDHPDPEGTVWLYTLFHRLTMWAWLRRMGDDPDSEGLRALLRDMIDMI